MAKTNKKFYVTTSIPYANAGPHIGHILDPLAADVLARYERIKGKDRNHQREPEVIEEENWFFRLSKYSKKIKAAIISGRFKIIPESRRNEILSFIKNGLDDVSFSRPTKDLSWGIPVPDDPTQTMYVWC